ncbi:unnamed protein product [Thelazia callipaeda]|uniref:EGF-like domain-containing protein n=1 Tax=Thelazia callipaeda TaxID=103827 RepID=A0A158RCL7_THECL|nr:unnamed protein product [Thelazia callipaeda]
MDYNQTTNVTKIEENSAESFDNYTGIGCESGYYYSKQLKKCIVYLLCQSSDEDECKSNEHLCSQRCINKPGGYECRCANPLYKLARDGHRCIRMDSENVRLFLAHTYSIWDITHNAKAFETIIANREEGKVVMFDYDIVTQRLYFVDLFKNTLQYSYLYNKQAVHMVQNHDIEGTEGIAVDWVHRNLYSLRQDQLHVQLLDGRFRTSLYKGFFQLPRALAVNPSTREVFASDWGDKPFIAALAMDGSHAKKIITENIVWPNALAVDYLAQRLYWADAFRDIIEMVNFDGSGRKEIITDGQLVPHVFGLTVFDDIIFWSDWNNRGLLFANKLTGGNATLLLEIIMPPYFLKAYHSAMQISGSNVCHNSTCQHLCVPKLDGSGPQCLCANGFIMHKNGFCEPNCKKNEILCSQPDHKCLNPIYKCDGLFNCKNIDDELGCIRPLCLMDERFFPCHDARKCILRSQRCDEIVDCYDSSDELYCKDLAINWPH